MTISKLASYARSCDKYNNRKGAISKITPHGMDGKMTGQQCVDYFCTTTRQCSANYCIGYDGSIAQCIPEELRAWTSGSYDNDGIAITIELSNNKNGSEEMSAATIESFINLCVDLIQRYPSLGGKMQRISKNEGNVTFHQEFQDTSCPGNWFLTHYWEIEEEINKRLEGGSPVTPYTQDHVVGETVTFDKLCTSSTGSKEVYSSIHYGTITKILSGKRNPFLINDGDGWLNNNLIKTCNGNHEYDETFENSSNAELSETETPAIETEIKEVVSNSSTVSAFARLAAAIIMPALTALNISVDGETIITIIGSVLALGTIAWAWWKNENITKASKEAQKILDQLKEVK